VGTIADKPARESAPVLPARVLLPGAARPIAAAVIGCCAVLVAIAGAVAAGKSHGNALDRPVDSWIRSQFGTDHATTQLISNLGVYGSDLVAVAIVVWALAARRRDAAALTLISVPIAFGVTEFVLKPLVHEKIDNFLTFPSGHTEAVICVAAILGVLLLPGGPPRWVRVLPVAVAAAAGVAVAVSMIALDYHYFTDTVAGAAVGTAVVLSTALLLDVPAVRRRLQPARQPQAPLRAGTTIR
jgi:membrane-associated phospholipid phosphatase